MAQNKLPYDPTDKKSIIEYATVLQGSTLREHIDADSIADPHRRKGSFGNAVEKYFFKYEINSDSRPDFPEAGLELKTTPLKKNARGGLVSKERLVITMINYDNVVRERFEDSSFMHKAKDVLLISYLYEKDESPLDYPIVLVDEWTIPKEDIPTIKDDWQTVVEKVRAGKAHEISSSDTMYLEACTKAANSSVRRSQPFSDIKAKPRAWALKSSYMTAVSRGLLKKAQSIERIASEATSGLSALVRKRFTPYFGLTEAELAARFGYKTGAHQPKNLCALITKRILGVDEKSQIAEFVKAGIKPKTMRLQRNGMPKEAVSFPAFDYYELVETPFEDSDFYSLLQRKYLFVIYREDEHEKGVFRLSDVVFWQMSDQDIPEAKVCYEEMRKRVCEGRAEDSVGTKENRCCHVRPHGRDSHDTLPTPQGDQVVKKCFWLNRDYLKDQIAKQIDEQRKR